jgi:hypothetical protein
VRFDALRLHEIGMIKPPPKKLIAHGTNRRFVQEPPTRSQTMTVSCRCSASTALRSVTGGAAGWPRVGMGRETA